MSDMGPTPDFQTLYQQVLQQYPHGKTPAADMKAAIAWKKMIDDQLGFDPMNYEAPTLKPFVPKDSVVKTQYANDPFVSGTLGDIADGSETSASVAAKLIDPATGEVTPTYANQGVTTAQATTAIEAAKAYEKEKAQTSVDQKNYEARQAADPTYGRTKGSTNGKQVLPEGSLTGKEMPRLSYDQALLDLVNGLSSQPEVTLPKPTIGPMSGHPAKKIGEIATTTNPYGNMQVDTSIHSTPFPLPANDQLDAGFHAGMNQPSFGSASDNRTMTPIMSQPTGYFAQKHSPLVQLGQLAKQLTPVVGPSAQERAMTALQGYQKFGQNYVQPVRSQANNAAVQKLLQVMALQG